MNNLCLTLSLLCYRRRRIHQYNKHDFQFKFLIFYQAFSMHEYTFNMEAKRSFPLTASPCLLENFENLKKELEIKT